MSDIIQRLQYIFTNQRFFIRIYEMDNHIIFGMTEIFLKR